MRRMKKLLAVMLAAIMVMSMGSMAVMADDANTDEYSITVSGVDTSSQTYQAYQVFSGYTSDGVIANIQWGTGVNYSATGFLSALQALDDGTGTTPFSSITDADDAASIAAVLTKYGNDSTLVLAFADFISGYLTTDASDIYTATAAADGDTYTYTFSNLPAGYYLVMDATAYASNTSSAYTNYILVTAGNAETDDSEDAYTSYNHVEVKATYPTVTKTASTYTASIGDTVTFTLTGTVPDMTYYDTYTYIFHDTLSAGLTYTSGSLTVTAYTDDTSVAGVELTNVTGQTDTSSGYTLDVTGQVITLAFSDLKTVVGDNKYTTIVVTYDATLNYEAVLGTTTNGNTNTVYVEYSNDPNWDSTSGSGSGGTPTSGDEPTGETVEAKVYVSTFQLDITKYASSSSAVLEGAIFQLYYIDSSTGSDVYYYAVVDDNGYLTDWTTTTTLGGNTEITSDSNGSINIYGLGEGTYYLEELKAPDGYNLLSDPIEFEITATTDSDTGLLKTLAVDCTSSSAVATATSGTGTVAMSVYNTSGSTLPTTGGIGTTLFYVFGTILTLSAAMLLVTRRRMAR